MIYPNQIGTRLVVLDSNNNVILYNPITGGMNTSITQFDLPPTTINNVLWDLGDRNIIMLFDGKFIHTYIYTQYSKNGSLLVKLGPLTISSEGPFYSICCPKILNYCVVMLCIYI